MIEAMLVLLLLVGMFVIVPLILLKVFFGLLFGLIALPFKILGGLFRVGFGLLGLVFKLAGVVLGVVGVAIGLVFALAFLPLLPFLLVGGLVWLIVRAGRPRPVLSRIA